MTTGEFSSESSDDSVLDNGVLIVFIVLGAVSIAGLGLCLRSCLQYRSDLAKGRVSQFVDTLFHRQSRRETYTAIKTGSDHEQPDMAPGCC